MDNLSIPGYRDFRLLGRGGSATVFRARQIQLERDVAIKVLRPGELGEQSIRLFDTERRALGRLKHPNTVTVFDSGFTVDGDPFLVMELCASGSMAALVKRSGPLPLEHVVRVGLRISEALDYAHQSGMIHRDVKPENILISDRGEPVLSDFGIASVLDDGGTTDGAMSPHHVAPELLRGSIPSASTDLYSLGSTLFYLLVGRTPHQNFSAERLAISELLLRVLDTDHSTELPDDADASKEVRILFRSLLAKDPKRRMAFANDAIDSFANLEQSLGSSRRRISLPTAHDQSPSYDESDSDSDATVFGYASRDSLNNSVPPYLSPLNQRDSLVLGSTGSSRSGTIGTLGDSERVKTATPVQRNADPDMTVVAAKASAQITLNGPGSPANAIDGVTRSTSTNRTRVFAMAACLLAMTSAAILFIVRQTGSADRVRPKPLAISTELEEFLVAPPSNVALRPLSNDRLEVTWVPDANPGVQYELEVTRSGAPVERIEVASPPVQIRNLDLASWGPCVTVSALNVSSSRIVTAEAKCQERVALEATADETTAKETTASSLAVQP